MMRNMVTSLLKHGRIKTTVTRAKELRILADRMITLGKEGTLHARRQALAVIMEKDVVARLFDDIAPSMYERRGGYTRIIRIGPRRGDGSMMCYIELVSDTVKQKDEKEIISDYNDSIEELSDAPSSVIPDAVEDKDSEGSLADDESIEAVQEESKGGVEDVEQGTSESSSEEPSRDDVNESSDEKK
jgi:large subunit ribosomal protein L17